MIAVGRHFRENNNEKHYRNAALGWYRYDSRFALPVYGESGALERYNVFHASMLVRHDENGKMYLYDVMDIKKKPATRLSYKSCTRHKTRSSLTIILCWSGIFVNREND